MLITLAVSQGPGWVGYWDGTNDTSYKKLGSSYAPTDNIPLYVNGVLTIGKEPPGGPLTTPDPQPEVATGDVNGNGSIDIIDALLTAQYYVGLDVP